MTKELYINQNVTNTGITGMKNEPFVLLSLLSVHGIYIYEKFILRGLPQRQQETLYPYTGGLLHELLYIVILISIMFLTVQPSNRHILLLIIIIIGIYKAPLPKVSPRALYKSNGPKNDQNQ